MLHLAQTTPGAFLQRVPPAIQALLHNDELTTIDVSKILKVFEAEMIPFHEKNTGHQSMGDQNTLAGEIGIPG